jgi:tricorn protease
VTDSWYLRYPHLAGDLLTFAAEDDIWLASLSETAQGRGCRARRLTTDRAPVQHPRLNPSATHVAWTSTRDGTRSNGRGPREAYAVPVDGGPGTRLTYWGDQFATVRGWVSDDEALVLSRAGQPSSLKTWAFAVPLKGPARRLDYGPAGDVSVRDGAVLVGSAMNFEPTDPAEWKRYGGGAGGRIWYSPDGSRYAQILADVGTNLVNPAFVGARVVFLSDHEGTGALYSAKPDGSDLRRHTDLGEYYARHATTDGQRVVYQRAGEIWLLASLDAEPVRLDIELSGERTGRASYPVSAAAQVGSFTLGPTGQVAAVEVRGTVHWLPARDQAAQDQAAHDQAAQNEAGRDRAARVLLATPGVRGRLPVIIPGQDAVVCASDRDGEDGLDVIPVDGSAARRIGPGEFGRILELAVAPDGSLAAVASDDGRLLTVTLDGQAVITEIARCADEEVAGLAFSPDSALLAWSQPWRPERGAAQIRLARLADGTVTDVTPPRFDDTSPAFTLDGKYLVFLSNRTFDPVYDAHILALGFLPGVRPYLVTLRATASSPFGPEQPDGLVEGSADIDLAGLAERIVPFPVAAGRYDTLRAVTGGVVWLDRPRAGVLGEAAIGAAEQHPTRLIRYDLDQRQRYVEGEGLDDFVVCAGGARLAYRKADSLEIKLTGADAAVSIDLDRIEVTVEPQAEWRQMYHETWRLMRDNFWRADLGGLDWAAMGERYRPLVDRIGCADDLLDVLCELQGETRTSHTGVLHPPAAGNPGLALGLLGADIEPTKDGTWRIARILPGESSVMGARSPLAAPGVAAAAGDHIVAVDGQPVDPDLGPNALLVGKAGQPVELTLQRDAGTRRAVVVPLASEHAIRYHDQVARQRVAVRAASGGRLGYLHIPGANPGGWAELHRDLYTEFQCDGLIVDLRDTMGGSASHLLAEKLARRIIGWNVSRYDEPVSYPPDAPRGAVVAITDGYASSGGDFLVQALKFYGISVVGTRTWGGVIGCDLRYQLIDGTIPAQPKYAGWFPDLGWGVDNHGVEPDVEVTMAPHDWAAGTDPQLDTAIRLALQALEQHPPAVPPTI